MPSPVTITQALFLRGFFMEVVQGVAAALQHEQVEGYIVFAGYLVQLSEKRFRKPDRSRCICVFELVFDLKHRTIFALIFG